MQDKKTMTLNLPTQEMESLERLCADMQMSKTAVMRQAFRLYQSVQEMMKRQNVHSVADIQWPRFPL